MRETGKGGNCQMTLNIPEKEGKESIRMLSKNKREKKDKPLKSICYKY